MIQFLNNLTSETGFVFFLIGTECWHNSHWFFTDFLNHVSKQVAWTNCVDPMHLHGAMSTSSPPVWHILQMICSSDPSVVSLESIIGKSSAIWVCCIFRITFRTFWIANDLESFTCSSSITVSWIKSVKGIFVKYKQATTHIVLCLLNKWDKISKQLFHSFFIKI